MAVQLSRFELLPPIIQEKILGKISSLIDLLRLHATNRSIAATVESIWFKKIKKLSVHIAGSDDGSGGPNLINGQEIPVQKIISAFEYLWKRAPSIISLKVIGRLLENVDWEGGYDRCMLVVLRQLMVDTPRTIRELQITIDRRQYAPEAHNLHAIKHMQLAIGKYHPLLELQDILGSVSATLEKFEFFLHTDRGNHFPPSDNFASLARCSLLKKLVLENIFVDWETLQIICQDKTELSHIVIREDIYAPQPWYQDIYENHILGIVYIAVGTVDTIDVFIY